MHLLENSKIIMRRFQRFVISAAVSLLVFEFGGSLLAQYTTSILGVSVVDPSGASVPEATIKIRSIDTGLQKNSTSGSNGSITFSALPVGNYAFEKSGFSTFTQTGVILTVDQPVNIPVRLKIGRALAKITQL
jgi:Carboxypeptidase regulatory-like domain